LTRSEEEEKVAEHEATFLDALKGLEVTREYMCQFDAKDSVIIMCSKVGTELYRLRAQECLKKSRN
jgi:hypothetical protein